MANRKTVLIADDDRMLVSALKRRCAALGVNVVTTYDTLATVLKIKDTIPDVVFLDLNMPGGSGLSICEMLAFDAQKQIPLMPKSVPIIVLTGRTDDDTIRDCQTLGAYYAVKGEHLWLRVEPLLRRLLGMEPGVTRENQEICLESAKSPPDPQNTKADALVEPAGARREMTSERCGASEPREILVIEDDLGVVEVVRHYLADTGFQVIHCDNLQDAKRLATHAAAVLCDIHLPNSRGTFIIRELRQDGYDRPIVVITGDSSKVTVIECKRSQVDGILLKPFSKNCLLWKLSKTFKDQPAAV